MITGSTNYYYSDNYIDKQKMVAQCVDNFKVFKWFQFVSCSEFRLNGWFKKPDHIGEYAGIYAEIFARYESEWGNRLFTHMLAGRASVIETSSVPGYVLVSVPFDREI